jgi:hypothetical protein
VDIANLAMIDFATHPDYPFRPFDDGAHTARKNEPATPFQCPCKSVAGAFYFPILPQMRDNFHTSPSPKSSQTFGTQPIFWGFQKKNRHTCASILLAFQY